MKTTRRNYIACLGLAAAAILSSLNLGNAALPVTVTVGGTNLGFGRGISSPTLGAASLGGSTLDQRLAQPRTLAINVSNLSFGPGIPPPSSATPGLTVFPERLAAPPPLLVERLQKLVLFTLDGVANGSTIPGLPASIAGRTPLGTTRVSLTLERLADHRLWLGSGWDISMKFPLQAVVQGGSWSTPFELPRGADLPDGGYKLVASAKDTNGVMATVTVGFTVAASVDKTPPVVVFETPQAGTNAITNLACSGRVDDPGGSGIAKVELYWEYYWDPTRTFGHQGEGRFGNPWHQKVPVAVSGKSWSFGGFPTSLPGPGTYTFTAFATDRGGNVSQTSIQVIRPEPPPPDRTAPVVTVFVNGRPRNPSQYDIGFFNSLTEISGTATDNEEVDRVEIAIYRSNAQEAWNGTAWAPAAGLPAQRLILNGTRWAAANLPNGGNLVEGDRIWVDVKAVDKSGNSYSATVVFGIDKTPPRVSVAGLWYGTEVPLPATFSGVPQLVARASDNSGFPIGGGTLVLKRKSSGQFWNGSGWGSSEVEIACMVNNSYNAARLWYYGMNLPEDDYEVTAKVVDYGGNSSTAHGVFAVDTAPPVVATTVPSQNAILAASSLTCISGTADDTRGIDKVTVALFHDRKFWFGDLPSPAWGSYAGAADDPRIALTTTLNGNTWARNNLPPISELTAGAYSLFVTAYDKGGNQTHETIGFNIQ